MNRRIIKQLIYGGFYLAVIFLIGFGIYYVFSSGASCFDNKQNQGEEGIDCGGSCVSCDVKYPKDLNVAWARYFPISDGKILAVASVENLNTEVGSPSFSYEFDVFSKDGKNIKQANNSSFIYAGEKKYILEAIDIDAKNIDKIEAKISNLNWKEKSQFSKPKVEIRDFKTEISGNSTSVAFTKFTRDLYSGILGNDVRELQRFLKSEGFFTVDLTNKFGATTRASLTNYQKKKGISPASGKLDLKTRNYINNRIDSLNSQNSAASNVFPISVTGVVVNGDVEAVSKIVVLALLRDKYDLLLSISKTEFDNLAASESKSFRILFPANINVKDINLSATEVYVYAKR